MIFKLAPVGLVGVTAAGNACKLTVVSALDQHSCIFEPAAISNVKLPDTNIRGSVFIKFKFHVSFFN